jgi:hypothetical protein
MSEFYLHKHREGELEVTTEFETNRGYEESLIKAQAAFARQDLCGPCDLVTFGYQKFEKIFSPERCAELIKSADGPLKNWIKKTHKRNIIPILDEIITDEVDKSIVSHFESEYLPTTIGFSRTEAGFDAESARWHYDGGPLKHLVMMIYLTDSEPDGASTTIFVNRETSEKFFECGYAYGPRENRQDDEGIRQLSEMVGIEFKPINLDTKAGDAVLFDARHIMHRGFYPKIGPRYSIALALIPYANNWKEGCDVTFFPREVGHFDSFPQVTW